MKPNAQSPVGVRDVAPGLWVWRIEHPGWKPGQGWEPVVSSTCVESRVQTLVLDPLAPPSDATKYGSALTHGLRTPLPALRALLDLPFEQVIVSYREPVHSRAAYERALELSPWSG